jgi:hypothetical protein
MPLACPDCRQTRGNRIEEQVDAAGEQVGEGRRRTLVGYLLKLYASRLHEGGGHQMLAGADAGGCDRNRARAGLCSGDDVRQLAMRQILAADHHVTEFVDQRDRHEVLARVVRQLRIQRRIERHVGQPADHKRVAIRLALARRLRADDGSGTGLVLDHEGLPHPLRQRVRKLPPDQIVTAARADRDDDFYRTIGIAGLRLRCGNAAHEKREQPCE